jgi:hypothetical protein
MGKFAETAIVRYRFSLPAKENKLPFSVSVCSKQTNLLFLFCVCSRQTEVTVFR